MQATNKNSLTGIRYADGSVLIVTMWIVLILASLTIVFAQITRVEAMRAANSVASSKAETAIQGATDYIFAKLASNQEQTVSYNSNPYQAVRVGDCYFWVIKPDLSDDKNYNYGLTELSSRINLNSASLDILLKLPGMTSELACSIIDWRDGDSEITQGGAENEYYLLLRNPYYCKNSPLESIEEILMIKGADKNILYGEDINRNGVLDPNENDGKKSEPFDNGDGTLDYGLWHYVTIHSYEYNNAQGTEELINVNRVRNQSSIANVLRPALGNNYYDIMNNIRSRQGNFTSLIDLYYTSGMTYEQFGKVISKFTTTDDEKLVGLLNVNVAPSEILLCLPGLEQSDVDSLISKRGDDSTDLTNILWVTQALSQTKAIQIAPYITTNSFQYSADIVVVSGDGRAFKRYYVIIDTADGSPKIIFKQPLHYLGWPLDPEILQTLRDNNEPD